MRKYLFILSLLSLTGLTKAQSPQKLSYQAVIRNSGNALVINSNIGMRVSLLQGSATGTLVYQEEYSPLPKSNGNGLVTLEIGTGTAITGTFSSIDWSLGNYFIKIETDPAGGTNYTVTGTHQLLSVPYALYSQTAAGLTATASIDPKQLSGSGAATGQVLKWNGSNWVPANDDNFDGDSSVTNELQKISKTGNLLTLSHNGGSVSIADGDSLATNEIQTISRTGNQLTLSQNGGSVSVADDDSSVENELQTIYRLGNQLTLSHNGGSVSVADGDSLATNELQIISRTGNLLTLSQGGGSISIADDDSSTTNELQTLSKLGGRINLNKNGGFIYLDDSSSTNELQVLSLSDDTMFLSNGGFIKIPFNKFAWTTSGNSGTDSNNFIGTTDKQALLFKVHNSASGVIDSSTKNTALGFLTNPNKGTYNTAIGNYALKSSTKNYNTAVGSNALETNQNGEYNTALGSFALNSQTTGSYNTALGTASMINSKNGSYNTSVGSYSMYYDSISSYNTAVGSMSMVNNNKGVENAALGFYALYNNITGNRNSALGASSMTKNTTGTDNVSVGNKSMQDNTSGVENTAIGAKALSNNVSLTGSVAVGFSAMHYANSSGTSQVSGNTAVGYEALRGSTVAANNTGKQNTAIGHRTILSNTTGAGNVALGYNSLNTNSTGNFNVSAGSQNLANNSSGDNNVSIGYYGMNGNTTGLHNISMGSYSMVNNKTGNNNIAIGSNAMAQNVAQNAGIAIGNGAMEYANSTSTSGANTNIAIGYNALRGSNTPANNTGLNNTALGYFSNNKNTTGNSNTSIGAYSFSNNTTGGHNVVVGLYASDANTTGNYNVSIGNYSNRSNISGENNTSIGYNANYSNVINHRSTAIGTSALYYSDNRTSSPLSTYNTAVGYEAMRGSTTAANNTGFSNAAFGDQALYSFSSAHYNTAIGTASLINLTTGIGNTALGFETGKNATTGGSNVFLGFQSGLNNATGSGNVFLGYSAGANETGSDKLYIANTNTSSPLIFGNFSTKSVKVNDSFISKYIKLTNGALKNALLVSDSLGNASWTTVSSAITAGNGLSYSGTKLNSVWTQNGNNIYNNNPANVGIGTSSPSYPMHISGGTSVMQMIQSSNTTGTWQSMNNSSTGGTTWDFISTGSANSEGAGNLLIRGNTSVKMMIKSSNGYVGMGTTAPLYNLHVNSNSTTELNATSSSNPAYVSSSSPSGQENGYLFKTYSSATTNYKRWLFGKSNTAESGSNTGSDFFINRYDDTGSFLGQPLRINRSSGFVGINTSSPSAQFSVVGSGTKSTAYVSALINNTATTSASSINKYALEIQSTGTWGGTGVNYGLYVSSVTGGALNYDAVFNGGGNVGIGVAGPSRKLVVADATTGFVAEIRNSNNSSSSVNHGLIIRAGSDVYNSSYVNNLITFNNPSASATFGGITQSSASGCSYATSSDIRLKENIKPTHFGLPDLMKIEVKDYTFKLDNGKNPQTGFIAQQLYSVYPQPVVKGNDTTNWMVDYGQVTPLLVKSVQDQQKIIETQKLELISQKELILQLMQRLEKLEQKSNQ